MQPDPVVSLDEVHAARLGDLYSIMDAATSGVGSGAWVKSVRIGAVPDRGGRVEGRARAAPMPGWTARKAGNEKGGLGTGAWHVQHPATDAQCMGGQAESARGRHLGS